MKAKISGGSFGVPKQQSKETRDKISRSLRARASQRRQEASPTYARAKVLHDHFVSAAPDTSAADVKVRNHGDLGRDVRPVKLGREMKPPPKSIEEMAAEHGVKRGRQLLVEREGERLAPRPIQLQQSGVGMQRSALMEEKTKRSEKARGSV